MTDEARADVNRRNAELSTGPRSADGKLVSRMNAFKHGLTAKTLVLPDERAEDFEAYTTNVIENLTPEGALEEGLAERIAVAAWRLRRALRVEVAVFERLLEPNEFHHYDLEPGPARTIGSAFMYNPEGPDPFSKLARYETAIERSMLACLHELQRLQAARRRGGLPEPLALDVGLDMHAGTSKPVPRSE